MTVAKSKSGTSKSQASKSDWKQFFRFIFQIKLS